MDSSTKRRIREEGREYALAPTGEDWLARVTHRLAPIARDWYCRIGLEEEAGERHLDYLDALGMVSLAGGRDDERKL